MDRLRRDGWFVASLVVAVAAGAALGLGVLGTVSLTALAALNSAGVRMYCDALRGRRPRRALALKALAVLLVPVGAVLMFVTPSGLTPIEQSTSGSADERLRTGTAGTQPGMMGPGGRTGLGG